jgi:hypothetical protein
MPPDGGGMHASVNVIAGSLSAGTILRRAG